MNLIREQLAVLEDEDFDDIPYNSGDISDSKYNNAYWHAEEHKVEDINEDVNDNIIWSTHQTVDYLNDIEDIDELKNELLNLGVLNSDLEDKNIDDLHRIINSSELIVSIDEEYFYDSIEPMIANQTKDRIIIMSGKVNTWYDSNIDGGKAVYVHELLDGGWRNYRIDIINDNGKLLWKGYTHDGNTYMYLYAIPNTTNELKEFVGKVGLTKLESELYGYEGDDAINMAIEDLSPISLNDAIKDWSTIKYICEPILNNNTVTYIE